MKKRILLVDDDSESTFLTKQILENENKCDYAKNGKIGLSHFKKNHYDLVITDNDMPYMTGQEMIRSIRKINRNIPIILLTGNTSIHKTGKDFLLIHKPFEIKQFKKEVGNCLLNSMP